MLVSYGGVTVGETTNGLFLTDVDLVLGDLRTGDTEWPIRHGSRPGADYLESGSLTMTLCSSPGMDTAAANAAVSEFAAAWRKGLRDAPGVMSPLRVVASGRERILWGRPGRMAPPAPGGNGERYGLAELTVEFRILDPLAYAATAAEVSVAVEPKSLGGIVAPIVTPVTTTLTSDTSYRFVTVGGDADAPFAVTFHGPATDPVVTVNGTTVGIVGALAYDVDVTVDGRARDVTRADGSPYLARLTRDTRLDRMTLPPGEHEISFTATDRTGTARATVAVTPAYYHV